jgi:uncharacterized small protein (DUF1192 family)
MGNGSPLSLAELDQRIAIVRDNIRQLVWIRLRAAGLY